jgi:hypothetical protein
VKKWLKWLLIIVGVAIVALIAYFIIRQTIREEAVLTFPDTIVVHNNTGLEVERVSKALSHYVFGFDTLEVMIIKMPEHMETVGDMDLLAYVTKNPFIEHKYVVFLSSKVKSSNLKKVLSHEFVHIKQMEEKRLIQFPPDELKAIWEGKEIDYTKIPYEKRPHEIDAHKQDGKIYNELDNILYK